MRKQTIEHLKDILKTNEEMLIDWDWSNETIKRMKGDNVALKRIIKRLEQMEELKWERS